MRFDLSFLGFLGFQVWRKPLAFVTKRSMGKLSANLFGKEKK